MIPCDLLLVTSSNNSGLVFLDTKDLDGETNLKEKMVNPDFHRQEEKKLYSMQGTIQCDMPNEYMDSWEGNIFVKSLKFITNANIKNFLLKGSILRNTEYVIGTVVYNGHNTKIMRNAKNPPIKMSNVMRTMNSLLLTVFAFQMAICIFFSVANLVFRQENNQFITIYIAIVIIILILESRRHSPLTYYQILYFPCGLLSFDSNFSVRSYGGC